MLGTKLSSDRITCQKRHVNVLFTAVTMHLVASGVLKSNCIKPWFHFLLLDSSAGKAWGRYTDDLSTITCCMYLITHSDLPAHQHVKRKKAALLHGPCIVCMFVIISRKAQVVKIVLTVLMGHTIKRIKCFQYGNKYF